MYLSRTELSGLLRNVVFGCFLTACGTAAAQPACDYYQNLLIGTMCRNTIDVGLAAGSNAREIRSGFSNPFITLSQKTQVTFVTEAASVTITPLDWLQFSVASSLIEQSNSSRSTFLFRRSAIAVGSPETIRHFANSSEQTYAGYQTLAARANLLDTGPGNARYVINAFATGGFVPGTDVGDTPAEGNARWQTEYGGGFEANGQWRIGASDYSIVARAAFQVIGEINIRTYIQPSLAVLLSNDTWGVAVGPVAYSNILLSRSIGVGSNPDSTFVGAAIRAQPFRALASPLLHDLTATFDIAHSVGQAGWVPLANGKASALVVEGGLQWHFVY